MSLESAIERLAIATDNNAAVQEIIRQRDEALKKLSDTERRLEWSRADAKTYSEISRRCQRKLSALRGVITRMKNQRKLDALDAPSVSR